MSAIQQWRGVKAAFIEELRKAQHGPNEALRQHVQHLSDIFNTAAAAQQTLNTQAGCCERLLAVSIVETATFGLGFAGVIVSNSTLGKEYPWLNIAALCAIAFAHFLSKTNDGLTHRANHKAQEHREHAMITGEEAFLNLAESLLQTAARDWEAKKTHLLQATQQHLVTWPLVRQDSFSSRDRLVSLNE